MVRKITIVNQNYYNNQEIKLIFLIWNILSVKKNELVFSAL